VSATARVGWRELAAAAILLGLAAVVLRLPAMSMPLDRDLAAYAVIGQRGGFFAELPYRDLFDHKQPLIYAVFWLLDLVAPVRVGAVRLTAALVPALAALALYASLTPHWGRARAAAAALVATVCAAAPLVEGTDLNTEHLLELTGAAPVLAALAGIGVASLWLPFGVGVLVAVAALTKAVGLLVAPAALLLLLAGCRRTGRSPARTLAVFSAGVALPALALLAGYALFGALDDLWFANVTYNRLYVEKFPRTFLPQGNEEVVRLAGLATAVGVVAFASRRGRDVTVAALLLWLAGAAAGAQLSARGFPHYYAPLMIPCAALLCAPVTLPRAVGDRVAPALAWAVTGVVLVIAALPFARSVADLRGKDGGQIALELYGAQAAPWLEAYAVGQDLRSRAGPGDRLFVSGAEPMFYWTSGLEPASRFIYDRPAGVVPERYLAAIAREVCARPPRFVVLPLGTWAPEAACLQGAGYRPVEIRAPVVVLERPEG